MIAGIERKFRQFAADPVLRRWLLRRTLGGEKAASFTAGLPPYLAGRLPLPPEMPALAAALPEGATVPAPATLALHGRTIGVDPTAPAKVFTADHGDIETTMALHRFAWLPFLPPAEAAALLTLLWPAWRQAHGTPDAGWAWHPYTAAERTINIMSFIRSHGWPKTAGPVVEILARHAPAIAARLEYFGEQGTYNHLANNGLGLYVLGADLAMPAARAAGFAILAHESDRLLTPAGVLREGSTHYHFLYTKKYLEAWLAAIRIGAAGEAESLRAIAACMLAAAKALVLANELPLIGDISPDSPPAYLAGLQSGKCPWTESLPEAERLAVAGLAGETVAPTPEIMSASGWIRKDAGRFSALAPCPPVGWPFMPGHAHQDMGSAEIHLDGKPLFMDPGRGRYGDDGDAALYRSSAVHGTIRIDGQDPYPPNKPYYSDAFRAEMAGAPKAEFFDDGFAIAHGGCRRMGIETVARRYRFQCDCMRIEDRILGAGSRRIERSLVTPLSVEVDAGTAVLDRRIRLSADQSMPTLEPVTIWRAYGEGQPGTRIVFRHASSLPWSGVMNAEVIG